MYAKHKNVRKRVQQVSNGRQCEHAQSSDLLKNQKFYYTIRKTTKFLNKIYVLCVLRIEAYFLLKFKKAYLTVIHFRSFLLHVLSHFQLIELNYISNLSPNIIADSALTFLTGIFIFRTFLSYYYILLIPPFSLN